MKETKTSKKKSFRMPRPNKVERELAASAPDFAFRIYQQRCAVAMAESYTGASKTRRALVNWATSSGDADTDILTDLQDLRERSRDLERNNSLAGSALATKRTAIVGTGLKLQARPNRDLLGIDDDFADAWENLVEAEWELFCSGCDFDRVQHFNLMQDLALGSVLVSGDTLINTPYRLDPGQVYGTKIQLIEADRICNENNMPDSENLSGGVERQNGFPFQYHVMKNHPGSSVLGGRREWMKLKSYGDGGRRNAWLLYLRKRIGQWRGIPDLAPIIEDLKQLGRYKEAELMATVVAAMFTVFIKSNSGGTQLSSYGQLGVDGNSKSSSSDFKLGNGAILDLLQDEDITIANPGRPNPAFEAFFTACTAEIGARLEIPLEVLTKRFQASYSAARGAFLMAWMYFNVMRTWLARDFCRPIYELFLTEAVLLGRVPAPGFIGGDPIIRQAWLGSEWIGDAPGHIDEGKAVQAAQARVDAGFSNEGIETVALTGRDRDAVYRGRKKEIQQRRADDMMLGDIVSSKESPAEPQNNKEDNQDAAGN